MLRIDCWDVEKDLKITPGSDCALTSLAVNAPLEYARLRHRLCPFRKGLP